MLPPSLKQGNGRVGVGSMCGFTMEHHLYIYHLYQRNPSRQLLGYVKKIKKKIGITISEGFMSRWFKTIGPFKETLRLTSKFPPAKGPLGNRLSSYTNISFSSPLWIIVDWYLQMRNHLKKRIFTTVYTEIRWLELYRTWHAMPISEIDTMSSVPFQWRKISPSVLGL